MKAPCPNCGRMFSGPDELTGKKARCKVCGEVITVPGARAERERLIEAEPVPPSSVTKEPVVEVPQAPVAPMTSGMAIASLVLGIVGFFFGITPILAIIFGFVAIASLVLGIVGSFFGITPILAIVFGFVARCQIRKSAGRLKGGGLAVAGITLGFTWLVIMIIVPAMLLLPALGRARSAARRAVCIDNLKQIGLALLIYSNDHEHLPESLGQLIPDYLPKEDLLHCPGDKEKEGISYIYRNEARGKKVGKKMAEIESADSYVILYDKPANHRGGRNVLFADGHAEWVWEEDFH